jgi:hypothetical protein
MLQLKRPFQAAQSQSSGCKIEAKVGALVRERSGKTA